MCTSISQSFRYFLPFVCCLSFYCFVLCECRVVVEKRDNSVDRIRSHNYPRCDTSDTEFELLYQAYMKNVSNQKSNGVIDEGELAHFRDWKPPSWIKVCPGSTKYPVNLTDDGFLAIGDVFYPSEDFCIEQ